VAGQRFDRAGLGEARQPFDEQVAVGEQAEQQPFDHLLLADD